MSSVKRRPFCPGRNVLMPSLTGWGGGMGARLSKPWMVHRPAILKIIGIEQHVSEGINFTHTLQGYFTGKETPVPT